MALRSLALTAGLTSAICSCQKTIVEDEVKDPTETQTFTDVDIQCNCIIDDSHWEVPTRATRAEISITRIAVKIFPEDDNTNPAYSVEQNKGETDFGTLSGIRLAPGKYTVVAVAHKASSTDSEAATITSPESVTIPEENMPETYACVKNVEVTSGNYGVQTINLSLNLCVTKAIVFVLDAIPANAASMSLTVNAGKNAPGTLTFNPSTGEFLTDASFTKSWDITEATGKKDTNFSGIACLNDYPKNVNITITASDKDGNTIATRTFSNIALNRAKVRKIKTYLFTGTNDIDMTFEEWGTDEEMEIY